MFVSIVPDTLKLSTALSLLQHGGRTHSITGFTNRLRHAHPHMHVSAGTETKEKMEKEMEKYKPEALIISHTARVSQSDCDDKSERGKS